MTIEEARKVWAQRSMQFRQRVKDCGLTADRMDRAWPTIHPLTIRLTQENQLK